MGKRVHVTDEAAAAVKEELEAAVIKIETSKTSKKSKKSSKKSNAEAIVGDDKEPFEIPQKKTKSSKKKTEASAAEADVAMNEAETTTDSVAQSSTTDAIADTDADAETKSSKKRKADLEEIQVDLSLPEPPSKKAKRLMKKGKNPAGLSKSKKKAAASDEDLLDVTPGEGDATGDDATGEKKEGTKKPRSEHCVWVGNLPFHVTTSELRKWLIDNSGGVILETSITRVKMPSSKEHKLPNGERQNKGFAYVDFDTLSNKVAAIALSETSLGTRKLLIKDSTSFEGRPKPVAETTDAVAKNEEAAKDAKPQTKSERDSCKKIYVGNMPFAANEDDVYTLFEKCGDIDWVKVATFEDSGKCKGYGWVKFKEAEAAASAVKGWVLVPQDEDNPEDFQTEEEKTAIAAAEATEEGDDTKQRKKPKKAKMRKWHVTRLKGRELKIELAEDNKTRYEKRFGRNSKQAQAQNQERFAGRNDANAAPDAMEVDA
ncbi:uncharacterized protein BROUX77_004908 [Berkeleyomyces rouxiae]|uniref:uncharacterized protein n=1 Tax=Berkeleyomyces rouxiae TaxID=2035830 RepID=UPI003B775DDB